MDQSFYNKILLNHLSCFILYIFVFSNLVQNTNGRPGLSTHLESTVPSCSEIENMKRGLNQVFNGINVHTAALRLGFHDCVGGCDGCINMANPDNVGLERAMIPLELLYTNNNWTISRSDFWALAAIVSVERGVANANREAGCGCEDDCPVPVPCFQYKWGRIDCPTSPSTDVIREFPTVEMNADQMFEYFYQQFGFSKQEVVAVMGAHTFGGAFSYSSGYSGVWKPEGANNFDNKFYAQLIDPAISWKNIDKGTVEKGHRWQWDGSSPRFNSTLFNVSMGLNTDFEIFYNLSLNSVGKSMKPLNTICYKDSSCGKNGSTPKSDTFDIALKYAKNIKLFITDFQNVFDKMITTGYSDLTTFGGSCYC